MQKFVPVALLLIRVCKLSVVLTVTPVHAGIVPPPLTVTDAWALAKPAGPLHSRLNVLFVASGPTLSLPPAVDLLPLQSPLAKQLLELVGVHVSVTDWPLLTVVGEAVKVTVGWPMVFCP